MENEMSIDQPPAAPAKPKTKGGWRKKGARAVPRAGVAMTSAQVAEIAAQVAQIMSQVPADAPRRIVPPRVGATMPALDPDGEDFDPLDPRVQRAAKQRLAAGSASVPRAQGLSDEEVLAMFQGEELGEFDVPQEIIPEGMVYGWWTKEVVGRENKQREGELVRRGWAAVSHERHPGMWGMPGDTGPITHKGLMLMELPAEQHALRERYQRLLAKQAVRDKVVQMGQAPPGTGPRNHPKLNNKISRVYEPLPIEP